MARNWKQSPLETEVSLKSSLFSSRPLAYLLIALFWAAIYLPGLSSIEIKGEEIRRIMPGVAMLETGNWIVPQFNGYPYLRKPPLVNWAIAGSIKLFGHRDEWTVRFPSALSFLLMGLVMFAACEAWLGVDGALAAVLMTLTCAGFVEKGRLAEIEAIYIALFGMAFACWLGLAAAKKSPWITWPLTGFLLGLGILAKGPVHLAFFYAVAGFIVWRNARAKNAAAKINTGFASWAHLAGVLIMLGVFALWCVPYMRQATTLGAGGVWARQMGQRIGGGSAGTIFINFLRSLVNFLPWTLGLPLFWHRATLARLEERDRNIIEAARWPIAICAFGLMFVPGMLPRYTLPLVIPAMLLLAPILKVRLGSALRWPLTAACIAAVGMLMFGLFFAHRVAAMGPSRKFASQINAVMPPGSPVYIFDPAIDPQVFYIKGHLIFQDSVKTLPDFVPWLVAPEKSAKDLRARFRQSQVLAAPRNQNNKRFEFISLSGRIPGKLPKGTKGNSTPKATSAPKAPP
jgi:4-amino-4-deoxy-L-arabinose transferase-like glycosyltransferase